MEKKLAPLLLKWFAVNGRNLPWRHRGGAHPDPYRVWVSEIMLQQTTVASVIPYFNRFMARFPNIDALASASLDDVFALWQGLGYYTRARSLHKTAIDLAENRNGKLPPDMQALLKLAGIGPYTAAAIMSLGFNRPETIVDGNVIRVVTRLYGMTDPVDKIMPAIRGHAVALTSQKHPGDYASAIMDLGATVCTPRHPKCNECPWATYCLARQNNLIDQIPTLTKLAKRERHANVYLIRNGAGDIFIRRRPGKKLLSGLYEFPWDVDVEGDFSDTGIVVTHVFTHFKLYLSICVLEFDTTPMDGVFIRSADFDKYATSKLMKKVFSVAQKNVF